MRYFLVLIAVILSGCTAYSERSYKSPEEAWLDVVAQVRSDQNTPHRGLMFLYSGPFGWSDPDWRITIDFLRDYRVEIVRFEAHPGFQARELFEAGSRDREQLAEQLRFTQIGANETNCPGIKEWAHRIWASVVEKSAEFDFVGDTLIRTDGGALYKVVLANGRYERIGYSTAFSSDSVVESIVAFERFVAECKS